MACSSLTVVGSAAFLSDSLSSSCSIQHSAPAPQLACSGKHATFSISSSHNLFNCGKICPSRVSLPFGTTRQHTGVSGVRAAQGLVERSYVMIKPDGVQRGLVGEIISRFERKGFVIKGLKLFSCSKELAEEHYKELSSKPFFPKLVQYITSGPVVCMALEGPGVVASARKLIGITNPLQAEPGTIRGDLGIETGRNVIHGSDSPDNGDREIALWFKEGEICEWEPTLTPWLRE